MYNQYMPRDGPYSPIEPEDAEQPSGKRPSASSHHADGTAFLGAAADGISEALEKLFRQFSFENFDLGDILLILIVLFLFLEGDNLDIVIALGLMLLFGLMEGDHDAEEA